MNKQLKSSFQILFALFILSSIFFTYVKAETTPGEAVKQIAGFNPEDLPTTPEGFKDKYLSREWSDLISKNKYLGPIHNFFLENQTIFKVLFGDPYAISLTFLLVFVLWLFIAVKSGQIIESSGILKGGSTIIAGFVFTILLAQTTLLRTIAKLCLDLVTKAENLWMRLIVAIVLIVLFFIASYLVSMFRKSAIENKKKKKFEEMEEKTEEVEAMTEGLKKD